MSSRSPLRLRARSRPGDLGEQRLEQFGEDALLAEVMSAMFASRSRRSSAIDGHAELVGSSCGVPRCAPIGIVPVLFGSPCSARSKRARRRT